jgi:hypothetical protein
MEPGSRLDLSNTKSPRPSLAWPARPHSLMGGGPHITPHIWSLPSSHSHLAGLTLKLVTTGKEAPGSRTVAPPVKRNGWRPSLSSPPATTHSAIIHPWEAVHCFLLASRSNVCSRCPSGFRAPARPTAPTLCPSSVPGAPHPQPCVPGTTHSRCWAGQVLPCLRTPLPLFPLCLQWLSRA